MSIIVEDLKRSLDEVANPEKATFLQRFFKTGKGQYAEGDVFLGITVPQQRLIVKEFYKEFSLDDFQELIHSNIHEHRLCALLILVKKYQSTKDEKAHESIVDIYLKNTKWINNWDLVDTSSHLILGHFAHHYNRFDILKKLSKSKDLWEIRISIVATLYLIKKEEFKQTLEIIQKNIHHDHDLIHKGNGWMLRELGKKNEEVLMNYLDEFATKLPRTTLRYSIERLDETLRQYYLKMK